MSVMEWGIVLGVFGGVVAMLFPWLLSIHGKVSRIDERTTALLKNADKDSAERTRLWERIDDHERRVIVLEQKE